MSNSDITLELTPEQIVLPQIVNEIHDYISFGRLGTLQSTYSNSGFRGTLSRINNGYIPTPSTAMKLYLTLKRILSVLYERKYNGNLRAVEEILESWVSKINEIYKVPNGKKYYSVGQYFSHQSHRVVNVRIPVKGTYPTKYTAPTLHPYYRTFNHYFYELQRVFYIEQETEDLQEEN